MHKTNKHISLLNMTETTLPNHHSSFVSSQYRQRPSSSQWVKLSETTGLKTSPKPRLMFTVPAHLHWYQETTATGNQLFPSKGFTHSREETHRTWLSHFPSCCWTSAFSHWNPLHEVTETGCDCFLGKDRGTEWAHQAFRPAERTHQRAGREKDHLCWASSLQCDTVLFAMTLLLKQIYTWTQTHLSSQYMFDF